MKIFCSNHPEIPSFSICGNCKKPYCKDCLNEGVDYYFCNSTECYEKYKIDKYYNDNPIFCNNCMEETTDEGAGNMHRLNWTGTSFSGKKNECQICHSYITNKCFVFFNIPIIKLEKYRVKIVGQKFGLLSGIDHIQYISRKLKK